MRSASSRASASWASSAASARALSAAVSDAACVVAMTCSSLVTTGVTKVRQAARGRLCPRLAGAARQPRRRRSGAAHRSGATGLAVAQPLHGPAKPGVRDLVVDLRGHRALVAEEPLRLLDPEADVGHLLSGRVPEMVKRDPLGYRHARPGRVLLEDALHAGVVQPRAAALKRQPEEQGGRGRRRAGL